MHRPRVVALEGIDGSGKTTLARQLSARFPRAAYVSNKTVADEPAFVREPMTAIKKLLWPPDATNFDHLVPVEYWLHLQVLWYTLFSSFVVEAPREEETLFVDGWYYRFVAKLRSRGYAKDSLMQVFRHVRQPDVVVLLDVEPAVVFSRRDDFRPHELGLHLQQDNLGFASFVNYQQQIADCLRELAHEHGWQHHIIPAGETLDTTAARISAVLDVRVT